MSSSSEEFFSAVCYPFSFGPFTEGFLSLCFTDLILIAVQTLILIIFGTMRIIMLLRSPFNFNRRYTKIHVAEIVISLIEILLPLMNLIYLISFAPPFVPSKGIITISGLPVFIYVLSFALTITWIFSLVILEMEYSHGRKHSWVIICFWVLSSSIGGIRLQTYTTEHPQESGSFAFTFVQFLFSTFLALSALLFNKVPPKPYGKEDGVVIKKDGTEELLLEEQKPKIKQQKRRQPPKSKDYGTLIPPGERVPLVNPFETANIFSKAIYWWMNPLLRKGFRRALLQEDLPPSAAYHSPQTQTEKLKFAWDESKQQPRGLLKAILKTYWKPLLISGLCKLGNDGSVFVGPLLLEQIVSFLRQPDEPLWKGVLYSIGLFLGYLIQSLCMNTNWQIVYGLNMNIRSSLISIVYQKSLTLSHYARQKWKVGEIVNFQSIDSSRIGETFLQIHILWSAPLQIIVSLALLWRLLGPSGLAGLAVMVLAMPAQFKLFSGLTAIQKTLMENRDKRTKVLNEVLQGIRVIKFFAWEESYGNKIDLLRIDELKSLREYWFFNALMLFLFGFIPILVSLFSFTVYTLAEGDLTSEKAFAALALFDVLQFPLSFLPRVIGTVVACGVSLKRVGEFLLGTDLDPNAVSHRISSNSPVQVVDASFTWKEDVVTLREISFKIESGQLVAIVGEVGSGKSSLLLALLGEMPKVYGSVYMDGKIAYVPQQAWIKNATVRDNILFGEQLNKQKYEDALLHCQLNKDLQILPAGDSTEIGEKGINLSGGQKQRISLARAVYNDADIYLLDDPLSAVDAHVGKAIFKNCINGTLKGKTRILVTHQLQYLKKCDVILLMNKGVIEKMGSYKELMEEYPDFSALMNRHVVDKEEEEEEEKKKENNNEEEKEEKKKDRLIEAEERKTGSVGWRVYWLYYKNAGVIFGMGTFLFACFGASASMGLNYWLSYWTNVSDYLDSLGSNSTFSDPRIYSVLDLDSYFYLLIYVLIGFVMAMFVLSQNLSTSLAAINSAKNLHQKMLSCVLHAPTSFFDTTPIGRILNRFGSDQYTVDVTLPFMLTIALSTLLALISVIIIISSVTPIFLVTVIPLTYLYRFIQDYYLTSSRELQRLDSISKSPIYALFSETLNGLSTIRAYNKGEAFVDENYRHVDNNQRAYYMWYSSNRWLAVRLEFLGSCVVFVSSLFAILQRNELNAGLAALSLTYALKLTGNLNAVVRFATEAENCFVSVERCSQYSQLETEAPPITNKRPSPGWPSEGGIKVMNLSLRYRLNLPLVLKGVDVVINPREKIGVVGRTGAGKSSLMLALFRIVEPTTGKILIDGEDISQFGLRDLRSRLAIIPQDPTLFTGTVRTNLDPFEEYDDERLLYAIKAVGLESQLNDWEKGLGHPVAENGDNLSVGTRQLMCLARAVLKKSRILVMDEATASVDFETDKKIQETIRREFSEVTVLTIAHRINTIVDSDKVLVLDNGNIAEFAPPQQLLSNESSVFFSLAKEAGLSNNANMAKAKPPPPPPDEDNNDDDGEGDDEEGEDEDEDDDLFN